MPRRYGARARRQLAACVCAAGALAGCQGPALPLATRTAPPVRTRGSIHASRFGRMAEALADHEGARRGRGAQVTDAMIERVERAVRLRLRAREPVPADCGMAKAARELPAPDVNGDGAQGGINPLVFVRGLRRLLEDGRAPYRLR